MISSNTTTAVLLSGGLDSCILAAYLSEQGYVVQPLYIRSQLGWEPAELRSLDQFLGAVAAPRLKPLVTLDLPVADLYRDHWSMTGCDVPGADTPDEAVYLPGRNALLLVKAAVWCRLNSVRRLALASLGTSPFADASHEFFARFEAALQCGLQHPFEILRPFDKMNKRQVMLLGKDYPLELTFSCIAPANNLHCGSCNKCAERQTAFRSVARQDTTRYAPVAAERR